MPKFDNQGTDFHSLQAPEPPDYDVQKAAEKEREQKRVKTDFQSLKREMPQWIKPTIQRTFIDQVIDFATPFFIFLMMFSILFFLLDVRFIYDESNDFSWRIIAFCLLMGIVALNRLIARDGSDESVMYILGLVGVTAFATLAFSSGFDTAGSVAGNFAARYALIFNIVVVSLLWWTTNRLTHECCVDENRVAGDMGILTGTLQTIQSSIRRANPEADKAAAAAKAERKRVKRRSADHILERMEIDAFDPTEFKPEKKEPGKAAKPTQRLGRRHPGISILLFSIPAMAVFALGLPVLLQGGEYFVLSGHAYVALYTFSSLTLLMLTSLGGLRQYFRSRKIAFAPGIAVFWMGLGMFFVLTVMFGAVALPKPDMPRPVYIAEHIVDPWRRGGEFRLRFAAASAADAAEQSHLIDRIGLVVLAGLTLFVLYSLVRLFGMYAASVGRNRDWYPESVVRLFDALDRFLSRILKPPELPTWVPRPRRRISPNVSEAIKYQNPMRGEASVTDDPDKVRDYIAHAYGALCALAMDLGVPRDAFQTPYEFINAFPKELKSIRDEARELTELYVRSEYSRELPPDRVLDRVRRFWIQFERIRTRHIR